MPQVDIMLRYKANWVEVPNINVAEGLGFKHFQVNAVCTTAPGMAASAYGSSVYLHRLQCMSYLHDACAQA